MNTLSPSSPFPALGFTHRQPVQLIRRRGTTGTSWTGMVLAASMALAFAAWSAPVAAAQAVNFAGSQRTLFSGLSFPEGVAVDESGNVYVADNGNNAVEEILAVNGSVPPNPTIRTLASGFVFLISVAVDGSGNVYVADTDAVTEILAVNGSIPMNPTIRVLGSGFRGPTGVAVDKNGNVYVADTDNSAVKEILAVNGSIPANPTISTLSSGFSYPWCVAVDPSGNVYVGDEYPGTVKEILAVNGSIPANPTIHTLDIGFIDPLAVAADGNGNVYLADTDGMKEILAANGSIPANPTIKTLGSGITFPEGVAVDGRGYVYVADTDNSRILELQLSAANFGSLNVCPSGQTTPAPCSSTLTLIYNLAANTTIGSFEVLTQGAPSLDFQAEANDPSNTLCSSQTYSSTTTCTVDVTFAPLYPGTSNGVVQILDGSENVLVSTLISGTGLAPQMGVLPGTLTTFPTASQDISAFGVATDGNGGFYYSDQIGRKVYHTANGTTSVVSFSGLAAPGQLAVDGAGTVDVLDGGQIIALNKAGVQSTVVSFIQYQTNGLEYINAFAIDGQGNLYLGGPVSNGGLTPANVVMKVDPSGNFSTIGTGYVDIEDLVIGPQDSVYALDLANGIQSILYTIDQTGHQTTVAVDLGDIGAAVVDAAGTIYLLDYTLDPAATTGTLLVIDPQGNQSTYPIAGLTRPSQAALDAAGNIYIANNILGFSNNQFTFQGSVLLLNRSAQSDNFGQIGVGITSAPVSQTLSNIGNQPLTGTGALSDYTDFIVVPGPGNPPDCNLETLSLAPGAGCNLSVSFTPQSVGPLTSSLPLSDNSLNGNPSTLTLQLSGTGIVVPQISSINPNFGAPAAFVTITGANFGATQSNGYVTIGGAPCEVIAWSNTSITIRVPSRATTANLVVTAAGELSNGAPFTFYPYPAITGFSSPSAVIGTTVSINGVGLLDGGGNTAVYFNGTRATINPQVASGTSLQVTVPPGATTGPVTVHANGDTATSPTNFTVSGLPVPRISAIIPNYGAPAAFVTITGANFGATQGSGIVTIGGAPSEVTAWSNTAITIRVPSRATIGSLAVMAQGGTSNGEAFTVYPYPVITGFSSPSAPIGSTITINGSGLLDGGGNGTVSFNGALATIVTGSSIASALKVIVPTGATTGPVIVHANGDTVESSTNFDVSEPVPQINGISPNYGAPAAVITVTGTNFGATQGGGSVTVGGAPSHIVSWSNSSIVIQVPSAAATGNLVVTASGVASNGVAFTFYPYPAITGFLPGSAAVGSPVTINGTGLLDGGGNGTVSFNGIPAAILSQTSDAIQVNVPAGATTGPISVRANGVTVESPINFDVAGLSVPQISGISPNYGAPSAFISITGTNFGATQGTGIVTVGGAPSEVTAWSNTAITIRVPSRAQTGNLVVMAQGGPSNGAAFTFYPFPSISQISPGGGAVGTTVTITGANLADGGGNAAVTFNGTPAVILSDTGTTIQVNVPSGATSGPLFVKVNGINMRSATSFTVGAAPPS